MFQFHMVRLKDESYAKSQAGRITFQFHMVRLKVVFSIGLKILHVGFNSTWYD